jgi:hypothetical protein
MHILDAAEQIGLLAVVRATTGEVVVSTTPPTFLSNNAPRVLADTRESVAAVIRTSNIRALVDSRLVTVLTPAR